MSQTQASGEEISHQAVKMALRVRSNYPVIFVCVVLGTKVKKKCNYVNKAA